jgi:acetylornithine/succinyldiaminopimelate/putrescine aminotransferase
MAASFIGETRWSEVTQLIELAEGYSAHNYHPPPLVVAEAEGAWVTDVGGRRYLDMVSAYSAMNFGHRHPQLVRAARAQLERVTTTIRLAPPPVVTEAELDMALERITRVLAAWGPGP